MRQPVWVSNNQSPLSQGVVQLICRESGSPGAQSGLAGVNARCWLKAGPVRTRTEQNDG